MQHEFFRWGAVHNATKLSRSTVWRLERLGEFPARRQLSGNSVGWLRSEVEAWIASRVPAARSTLASAR